MDDTGPSEGRLSAYVGNCVCGSSAVTLLRCDQCPVAELERVRSHTAAGRLLERVLELDFDTERFSVSWDEVTCEEAMGIKVLKQEREKWRAETIEEQRREAEIERAQMDAKQRQRGGF